MLRNKLHIARNGNGEDDKGGHTFVNVHARRKQGRAKAPGGQVGGDNCEQERLTATAAV
jgi:hypothetical protein